MSENTDVQAWIARAEEDYALARSALRRKKPLSYGATLHAQQCAEKYLKAALLAKGQAFPRTHDLLALSHLCTQAGLVLEIDADLLDTLSSYAVKVRYPGADPTPEEARHALEIAKVVRRLVRKLPGLK
jgi:HEPN domain-containing protein